MSSDSQATAIMFLRAQTPLHPGSGGSTGAIDMTIQREAHTLWPTIHSSGLKGVLRDAYRRHVLADNGGDVGKADRNPDLCAIFGPARADKTEEGFAGSLAITDARILAFPVAAVRGVFSWVTCKSVVERLERDLKLLARPGNEIPVVQGVGDKACVTTGGNDLLAVLGDNQQRLMLRDMEWEIDTRGQTELNAFAEWLAIHACGLDPAAPLASVFDPRKRLVLIPDDDFTHLVRFATEIVTHNALDLDTRTVTSGALFNQELLPAETLMYAILIAERPRKNNNSLDRPKGVIDAVKKALKSQRLQIGANETTGKGWCWARVEEQS